MNDVSILVVDDDDDVRTALLDELSLQYAVTGASCGVDAIAALTARSFDVVISDLRMPDHDGIEVLDFARAQQAGIIRILLTGYVDDRAHSALLEPDAPYKVGKPWYDEIEVILTRALEQRRRTRQLSASLTAAFSLNQLEAALATTGSHEELAELLALRGAMIDGVDECGTQYDGRVIAGQIPADDGGGWRVTLPIDREGRLRLVARGHGEEARELVTYLCQLAQRRDGTLTAAPRGTLDPHRPRRSRIDELMRQATLGAMAGAVLHDVAGIIQGIEGAVLNLSTLAEDKGDPELVAAVQELASANDEAVELFVAMRKFMRDGKPTLHVVQAEQLVQRTLRQVGGLARERATLRVVKAPHLAVRAAEPLFVQVLGAVIRNAATASPAGGTIDVEVRADGDDVKFIVTDDGAGVAADVAGLMFEACVWHRPEHVGTGLAIAAHALAAQEGTIAYGRAPGRGACFTITLPRAG